jgi:hypothetical protein
MVLEGAPGSAGRAAEIARITAAVRGFEGTAIMKRPLRNKEAAMLAQRPAVPGSPARIRREKSGA